MAGNSAYSLCLLLLTILLTVAEIKAQSRAQYGKPCSRINRCDSRASLACTNGTCECIMTDLMTFDGTKCAVFAGEKCTYTAVDIQSRGDERSWREELPCVKNAACQENFCTCLQEFYESSNGTCIRKRGFQENCEFDLACNNEQLLYCNDDKTCGCNSTISMFDLSRQLCVIKAGQPCENAGHCVPHGTCIRKVCKCDSVHFQNSRGECEKKKGHNEPCENDNNCQFGNGPQDLQLVCSSGGICECRTDISMYNPSRNLCVKLAGEVCNGFPNCVDNSVCSQTENFKMCTCNPEYFKNSNGICESKREHGNLCESDENCKQALTCNSTGLCDCDRNVLQQFYDSTKGKCVGLVGAICRSPDECVVNSVCYDEVYGLECYPHYGCHTPLCKCRSGFTKTKSGTCLVPYGGTCGSELAKECNEEEGIVCKQAKCVCKYDELQTYDSDKKQCLSKVSSPCDNSIPCVAGAHCSDQDEFFKYCVCNDGFVAADSQCFLGFGQKCNSAQNNQNDDVYSFSSETCDKAAPFKCIKGVCQCNYLEEYDADTQKCKGLVGSGCGDRDADFCTPNAECVAVRATKSKLNQLGLCKCKKGWTSTRTRRCVGEMVLREEYQTVDIQADFGATSGASTTENSI